MLFSKQHLQDPDDAEGEFARGGVARSCIADAIFLSRDKVSAVFPQAVSGELASTTILYTIFASSAVITILAIREKVDKKAGIIFVALYLLSYIIVVILMHSPHFLTPIF